MVCHRVFHSMGLPIHLTLAGVSEHAAETLALHAKEIFDEWDSRFSRFREDSELAVLNKNAGSWQTASPTMFAVLQKCMRLAEKTQGVFDPSVGSYLAAAGYGLPKGYRLSAPAPTFRDIVFDEAGGRIRAAAKQILEPAAIVKGMAIDAAGMVLTAASAWMINAGGDILTRGEYPEQGHWNVGIQHPQNREAIAATIKLKNAAVATSGTYETKRRGGGAEWNHQIEMGSGQPLFGLQSVTIVAPTAEAADTAASMVVLLGLRKGISYTEERSLPYMIIDSKSIIYKNNLFSDHERP